MDYSVNQSTAFTSRNMPIRMADSVMRRVRLEFPTYSGSKIKLCNNAEKNERVVKFIRFVSMFNEEFRLYYFFPGSARRSFYREILGMKKNKVGNCGELADATVLALKMNGYCDAKKVELCALNKKTGKIRRLDHYTTVVGLNGKKTDSGFIIPNRDAIVVDSWAGFTDDTQGANQIYKNRSWSSSIAVEKNNIIKLNDAETICFSEVPDNKITKEDFDYLIKVFPNLLLKNKCVKQVYYPDVRGLSRSEVNGIRLVCGMEPIEYDPISLNNRLECPKDRKFSFFDRIKNVFFA